MHLWRAVVSSQPTRTGDENHNRDKERDAQEVVEVVVNKARISQWFDGEPDEWLGSTEGSPQIDNDKNEQSASFQIESKSPVLQST